MNIKFQSRVDNFLNETIEFLLNEKLGKLKKYGLDDFIVYHKIRDNGNHKIKIELKDYFAKAENKNFETALIDVIENIERQHLKAKDYVGKKKKQHKTYLERKIEEEIRLLNEGN